MPAVTSERVDDAFPTWTKSDWEVSTAPSASVNGVVLDADEVSLGSAIAAGALGPAKGLGLQFGPDFDDSVWTKIRVWMRNHPLAKFDATVEALFGDAVTFGITSDVTAIAGTALSGDPYADTVTGTAAGAASAGTDEYDPAANLIREMVLQLNVGAAGIDYDLTKTIHGIPELVLEMARTDYDAEDRIMDPDIPTADEVDGHVHTFAEVELYWIHPITGNWHWIQGIKDNTITITKEEELADWVRGKPARTYHQARSVINASFAFQLDQKVPAFLAQASQTTAKRNSDRRRIEWSMNGQSTKVVENCWAIRYRTHGGFLVDEIIPRGVMTVSGDATPGGDDWAGYSLTIKGLNSGRKNEVNITRVSDTPVEQVFLPLVWSQT